MRRVGGGVKGAASRARAPAPAWPPPAMSLPPPSSPPPPPFVECCPYRTLPPAPASASAVGPWMARWAGPLHNKVAPSGCDDEPARPAFLAFKELLAGRGTFTAPASSPPTPPPPPPESAHCTLKPLLALAHWFGVLPVDGVRAPAPAALHFRWRSPRTLWALFVAVLLVAVAATSIQHVVYALGTGPEGFMKGIGVATSGTVFYGCSSAAVLLFLRLARRWPRLQRRWAAVERDHAALIGWPRVRHRARAAAALILTLSYVEHLLSVLVHIPECLEQHDACDFLRLYMLRSHGFVFSAHGLPYSPGLGVLVVLASETGTFAWNFADVFVVVISGLVAGRLNALNKYLTSVNVKTLGRDEWERIRAAFASASGLVKALDDDICGIVLLSFGSNLYFICLQLLLGLSPRSTRALDYVYFFGSFAYLLTRTVAVTLSAARIHDQSRVALPVLYQCPAASFCPEAQRLQAQLTSDELSLTGLRFFAITRSFLLAVAGAVITYEVILLQFNMSPALRCGDASALAGLAGTNANTTDA